MIRWITDYLGTAKIGDELPKEGLYVLDVRDLVDKAGNPTSLVKGKIDLAIAELKRGNKVVVCCDLGMSRSNAVAAGILSAFEDIPFDMAVRELIDTNKVEQIKVEVLSTVRNALEGLTPGKGEEGMRILVTGASGSIGTAFYHRLTSSGYEVTAPTRSEVDLAKGAVSLDLAVRENKVNVIVHLANPRVCVANEAMGETLVMLRNVLEVCLSNDVFLVYPSNWEVYSGYEARCLLASESLAPRPRGIYGETKYLCEKLIENHEQRYELRSALVRFAPVYGYNGDKPRFLFNFLEKALQGEDIIAHKYQNGYPHLDLLHIEDAVRALMAVVTQGYSGTLNIGSGKGISTTDVAKRIIRLAGSRSGIVHRHIEQNAPNVVLDSTLARSVLHWRPMISFNKGLERLVNDYMKDLEHDPP